MLRSRSQLFGQNNDTTNSEHLPVELAFAVIYSTLYGQEIEFYGEKASYENGFVPVRLGNKKPRVKDRMVPYQAGIIVQICKNMYLIEEGEVKGGNVNDIIFAFAHGYCGIESKEWAEIDHNSVGRAMRSAMHKDLSEATERLIKTGSCYDKDHTETLIPVTDDGSISEPVIKKNHNGEEYSFVEYSRDITEWDLGIRAENYERIYRKYNMYQGRPEAKQIERAAYCSKGLKISPIDPKDTSYRIWESPVGKPQKHKNMDIVIIGETPLSAELRYMCFREVDISIEGDPVRMRLIQIRPEYPSKGILDHLNKDSVVIIGRTDILERDDWLEGCKEKGIGKILNYVSTKDTKHRADLINFSDMNDLTSKISMIYRNEMYNERRIGGTEI